MRSPRKWPLPLPDITVRATTLPTTGPTGFPAAGPVVGWRGHPADTTREEDMTETETFETVRYTADVVCVRDGSVLLIERGWPPYQGQVALPGGHVDVGETSRAAGARELLEEAGVDVDPEALVLVGVYDAPLRDPRGRYVTVAYLARVPAGTAAQARDDDAAVQ